MSGDFNPEQKRYLEGFVAGLQIAKAARASAGASSTSGAKPGEPGGPDAAHLRAQDRVLAAGGKLSEQEKFKRELHPFDRYERLKAQAANNEYPKAPDNFRWRFFGLLYVAPNQNSYMCRLRMPNGILAHWQAAMGQQDCRRCGYNCQDYSEAIFLQKEERLNLCVPGGKETTRVPKALHQQLGKAPGSAETPSKIPTPAAATVAPATAPGCSRECPTAARFLSRTRLNKAGSEKETWHIEFDLRATGIDYAVGDAFGVFPTNDHPALADGVISALAAPPDFPIGGRALRDVLIDGVSLGAAPDMLFQLFSYVSGGERRQKAKALAAGEDPDGDAGTLDVLAAIKKFPAIAFVANLKKSKRYQQDVY